MEKNFLRWTQPMKFFIKGRGKMGFLDGSKKASIPTDPSFQIWDAENSMLMSLLVNSIEPKIS